MSRNVDTYLKGESYRSEILMFNPAAICSIVSIRGIFPFIILLIVDFETPVKIDTWRTDNFFEYMILSNNIFMLIVYVKKEYVTQVIIYKFLL